MFFRWFVSNGLWNVIPKETSNSAEAKSPKLAYGLLKKKSGTSN